jgi:hypothetical protein
MYSPKLLKESFIQYIGVDSKGSPMFFENASKTNLSQHKSFDIVGKSIRTVSVQSKNGKAGDTILIEINGVRVLDNIPLFQSHLLEVSDTGVEVKELIDVTIMSESTNPDLEVVVLFGVDCSL